MTVRKTLAPRRQFVRTLVDAAANPRATELHFAQVATAPSGTPSKITAYVDSARVAQPMRYLASYTPSVGDIIIVLLVGTDHRLGSQYVAIGKLA